MCSWAQGQRSSRGKRKAEAGPSLHDDALQPGRAAAEITAVILDMEGAMADAGRRRGWCCLVCARLALILDLTYNLLRGLFGPALTPGPCPGQAFLEGASAAELRDSTLLAGIWWVPRLELYKLAGHCITLDACDWSRGNHPRLQRFSIQSN